MAHNMKRRLHVCTESTGPLSFLSRVLTRVFPNRFRSSRCERCSVCPFY